MAINKFENIDLENYVEAVKYLEQLGDSFSGKTGKNLDNLVAEFEALADKIEEFELTEWKI